MDYTTRIIELSLLVFNGLLACIEFGFRLGRRDVVKHPEQTHDGIGAIEAAVFALLGLLLAFSLSGASGRLDNRRQLIIEEANAIGTAYLRLDLLPPAEQPTMRLLFRDYLDARLSVYALIADLPASREALARATALQRDIWIQAVSLSRVSADPATELLLLPAINDMIDITTTRTIALNTHLPAPIVLLLIGMALLSGLVAGYAMARRTRRSWLHMILYAGLVAVTLYVALDVEYPRSGVIRLDAADRALYELRDSIR